MQSKENEAGNIRFVFLFFISSGFSFNFLLQKTDNDKYK